MAGGFVYWLVMALGAAEMMQQLACALVVVALRMGALHWNWQLPVLSYDAETRKETEGGTLPPETSDRNHEDNP